MFGAAKRGMFDHRLMERSVLLGKANVQLAHPQRPIGIAIQLARDGFAIKIEQRGGDEFCFRAGAFAGEAGVAGEIVNVVEGAGIGVGFGEDARAQVGIIGGEHAEGPREFTVEISVRRLGNIGREGLARVVLSLISSRGEYPSQIVPTDLRAPMSPSASWTSRMPSTRPLAELC